MPDEANSYLNHQWQKARAEFKRQNIAPYGFRVAEPHRELGPGGVPPGRSSQGDPSVRRGTSDRSRRPVCDGRFAAGD